MSEDPFWRGAYGSMGKKAGFNSQIIKISKKQNNFICSQ